jgi:hypothetical protein
MIARSGCVSGVATLPPFDLLPANGSLAAQVCITLRQLKPKFGAPQKDERRCEPVSAWDVKQAGIDRAGFEVT